MRSFAVLFVVFIAFVALARPAHAQAPGLDVQVTVVGRTAPVSGSSSDHFLTFSAPVQVPGVALKPGAYIFRFVAPSVLQVLSEDRSMVYAMFFATPTWRSEVTSDYAVTLRKIRSDADRRRSERQPERRLDHEGVLAGHGDRPERVADIRELVDGFGPDRFCCQTT